MHFPSRKSGKSNTSLFAATFRCKLQHLTPPAPPIQRSVERNLISKTVCTIWFFRLLALKANEIKPLKYVMFATDCESSWLLYLQDLLLLILFRRQAKKDLERNRYGRSLFVLTCWAFLIVGSIWTKESKCYLSRRPCPKTY